jgi:dimethylargininase
MHALTHAPSPNLDRGLRTHVARVAIDFDLALRQHAGYCDTLRALGVEVHTLDVNRDWPDAPFIEDTAVVLDEIAVLLSMGAEERRGERAGVAAELKKYREVHRIEPPATIEGGDVLRVGRDLLVGASARTGREGVLAFQEIVRRYGYRVRVVPVRGCLHLKTAVTALPDGRLLANRAWLGMDALEFLPTLEVPAEEPWGANTLPVRGSICLAAENVRTAELLGREGFDVRPVPLSEFAKAEGSVTCLSLLIGEPAAQARDTLACAAGSNGGKGPVLTKSS